MIVITIERKVAYTEKQNLVTKETPTDKKDKYESTHFQKEYAVVDVAKERTERMLVQEIADESKFDLAAVIKAVNGL